MRRFCYAFSDASAQIDASAPADASDRDATARDHGSRDQAVRDLAATDLVATDLAATDRADAAGAPDGALIDRWRPDVAGEDVIAEGCVIGGQAWSTGAIDPVEPCRYCDPRRDLLDWTARAETAYCDDGDGCTTDDYCQAGRCTPGGFNCYGICDDTIRACCGAFGEVPCSDGTCPISGTQTVVDGGVLCGDGCAQEGDPCCSDRCLPGLGCMYGDCVACGAGTWRGCTDYGPYCGTDQVFDGASCVVCGFEGGACCPGNSCGSDPLLHCCNRYRPPGTCLYYACTH